MQAAVAERPAAVRPFPGPGHGVLFPVNLNDQDRLHRSLGPDKLEPVVELVLDSERRQTSRDGVFLGRRGIGLDHLILAIRPAVARAEQCQESVDVLGVLAAHAPMQNAQPGPVLRRGLQGGQALVVGLDPLRPLGHEQDDAVGPLDQLWSVLPFAVGLDERRFDPLDRLQDLFKYLEAVHVLVGRRRVTVGPLADKQQLFRSIGDGRRANEKQRTHYCVTTHSVSSASSCSFARTASASWYRNNSRSVRSELIDITSPCPTVTIRKPTFAASNSPTTKPSQTPGPLFPCMPCNRSTRTAAETTSPMTSTVIAT